MRLSTDKTGFQKFLEGFNRVVFGCEIYLLLFFVVSAFIEESEIARFIFHYVYPGELFVLITGLAYVSVHIQAGIMAFLLIFRLRHLRGYGKYFLGAILNIIMFAIIVIVAILSLAHELSRW